MKIRDRLALYLTLSAAGIILLLSLLVYFGSVVYRKQHFFKVLEEMVVDIGKGSQELSPRTGIRPTEVFIYPVENKKGLEDSLVSIFPAGFVKELFSEGNANFQAEEAEGVGQLFEEEKRPVVVIVAANDRHGKAQLENLRKLLTGGFLLSLPLLYFLGRLSAGYILKPIADKIQKARRISASNLHLRLNVYNEKDELGQLAIAFNEMLERLETSFEMQRNFISNASHEIRNPLTVIIGEAEVCLERKRSAEEYIESLQSISREADRLDALVNSLLSLAKAGFDETELAREEIRLDEVLLEARLKADRSYPENRIRLDFSALPENPDLITLNGNSNLLQVAFTNLMENACKFSDKQEVVVKLTARQEGVQLQVIDKGVGIPEQEIQNIFQPFYRARNARTYKGFGIGLALTDKIIRLHKGQMRILSEEGKGTTVEVTFKT